MSTSGPSGPLVLNFIAHEIFVLFIYGLRRQKTCLWGFSNIKGTDQPVHPHSLISAFVIRFLESIISKLATREISIL